jgi:NitT/TauT family transport system substrate-binding protein
MNKKFLKLFSILASLFVLTAVFSGCKKDTDNTLTKIRLNEVTRSIFYAPMYAAINQGFFKEEGLEIDLTTGEGADATVTNTQVIQGCRQYLL